MRRRFRISNDELAFIQVQHTYNVPSADNPNQDYEDIIHVLGEVYHAPKLRLRDDGDLDVRDWEASCGVVGRGESVVLMRTDLPGRLRPCGRCFR